VKIHNNGKPLWCHVLSEGEFIPVIVAMGKGKTTQWMSLCGINISFRTYISGAVVSTLMMPKEG